MPSTTIPNIQFYTKKGEMTDKKNVCHSKIK